MYYYIDEYDQNQMWTWGFLTASNPNKLTNYDILQTDKWYSFTSQNLMYLNPKPKKITSVSVGGNGWDFHGRIDNIEIVGE